jgi:ribonuclease R
MAGRRRGRGAKDEAALEQAVLDLFREQPRRGFKLKEIQRALGVPHSRYRLLRDVVQDLAGAGRIAALPRRRFSSLQAATRLEGEIEGIGQHATHVRLTDGKRLPVTDFARERVVPGDRVRVRRTREGREVFAEVERILEAAPRLVIGELLRVGSGWVLDPVAPIPGFSGGPFVDREFQPAPEDEGRLARGWLPAFEPAVERPRVRDLEVLGSADQVQPAMTLRIARDGWPLEFGERALAEATEEPDAFIARRDLTEEFVFTIDPLTAKDHDDAVSIECLDGGGFVLGVHIADVAARVREGGPLDEEARGRATSVYPPGTVLPMLPERLSAGACSLHHGVERDTLTVRIRYGRDGSRQGIGLGLTRTRSRASLAYEHAEQMLHDDTFIPPGSCVSDGVDPSALRDAVRGMHRLAGVLRSRRRALGSLFVQRPEREFEFDASGDVKEVHLRPHLDAHWIIEEFMLEANRAVAETLQRAGFPLLWRIHEAPDETKVDELSELLGQFGVTWLPDEPVSGHDYGDLFAMIEDRPERGLLHLLALRSLMKARYRAGWDRHFGLAFERYTHFTSPIRRYPDLHNQRWLHRLVACTSSDGWLEDATAAATGIAEARLSRPADFEHAVALADHCSERERVAQRIERDCADICAAAAIKGNEGDRMDGMVVSVLGSGLFVELGETGLDGFVAAEQLGNDWYRFDPERHALVGERTGARFRLGQTVSVLLEYVDVAQGRVWLGDLKVLAEPGSKRLDREKT